MAVAGQVCCTVAAAFIKGPIGDQALGHDDGVIGEQHLGIGNNDITGKILDMVHHKGVDRCFTQPRGGEHHGSSIA